VFLGQELQHFAIFCSLKDRRNEAFGKLLQQIASVVDAGADIILTNRGAMRSIASRRMDQVAASLALPGASLRASRRDTASGL
jgi:hypothetical protein